MSMREGRDGEGPPLMVRVVYGDEGMVAIKVLHDAAGEDVERTPQEHVIGRGVRYMALEVDDDAPNVERDILS